jgi:hypothetical protein
MSKVTTQQTNFTAGEISPQAMGRFDLAKFANGVKILANWFINQLGGANFRPGTYYVAETSSSGAVRLIPFQFSTTQNYVLEFGNNYIRFFANNGRVESGGLPVQTTTTYATDELFELHFAQDADTLYITHPNHKPAKLERVSATSFTLTDVTFKRGPFLDTNITTIALSASADTGGPITISAGANLFNALHSGALWRIKNGVVLIDGVSSATTVTATVQAEPDGTAGNLGVAGGVTTDWAEGAFSDTRGWPHVVEFHEQRLYYGNTDHEPMKFWGSNINSYDNFDVGTAADDEAVAYALAARQVNAIKWLASNTKYLQIGTAGGNFSASSGTEQSPITPTEIVAHLDTIYGASGLKPVFLGNNVYYIQRDLNKLRELAYFLEIDAMRASDMNLLAEHILKDGLGAKDIAYQQSPNDRIWVVRNDGQIAVLTRNAEEEVMGWSRIIAGSDAQGAGVFESIAIIPRDNDDDQIWVVVKRVINGVTKRYIEYFTDEDFTDEWDPVRVDSALTLDNPLDISAISKTNPVVITSNSHGLSEGTQIKITGVLGMTDINNRHYLVISTSATAFALTNLEGDTIDGTGYGTYISGGEIREMVTDISGLSHLAGETVTVQVDGGIPAAQQTFLVNPSGSITLLHKAAVVHAGLPYTADMQLLKLSDGSPVGTGQTKNRRIYLATLRVYRSLGMQIGTDEDNLDTVYFGKVNDPLGEPPELVTGDVEKHFGTGWFKDTELLIRQAQPLPLNILCVILRSEVEEK